MSEAKLRIVAEAPVRLMKLLTSARARVAILARAPGLLGAWSRSMVGAALKDDSVKVLVAGADPAKTPSLQPQKSTQLSVGDAVVLDIARIVRRESTLRKERAERAIKTIYYEDADILVFAVEAGVGEADRRAGAHGGGHRNVSRRLRSQPRPTRAVRLLAPDPHHRQFQTGERTKKKAHNFSNRSASSSGL